MHVTRLPGDYLLGETEPPSCVEVASKYALGDGRRRDGQPTGPTKVHIR